MKQRKERTEGLPRLSCSPVYIVICMAGSGAISRCVGVMSLLLLVMHEGRATSSASPCCVFLRNGNGPGKFILEACKQVFLCGVHVKQR